MLDVAVVLLCLHAAIVIGISCFAPRYQTDDQFTIGERNTSSFGLTLSIFSTLATESLIFFAVTLTARYGPFAVVAGILGPCTGLVILSSIAGKARAYGRKYSTHCISEYCLAEWGPILGAFARFTLLIMLFWVAILQINLNGKLISVLLHWPVLSATWWAVLVVLCYVLIGGYWTVIRTDIFQSFVLGMMVLVPFVVLRRPRIATAFYPSPPWKSVLLIFAMSFALTITRPELWQRVYSAASEHTAAVCLRRASLLFACFGALILYYAISVVQAMPGTGSMDMFARGYGLVLSPAMATFFPVILVAATMSSLDSATFAFSVSVSKQVSIFRHNHAKWTRIFIVLTLLSAGVISLTIFDSLVFAYKLDGIVALLAVPLFISHWMSVPRLPLGIALGAGLAVYTTQIAMHRIDLNPVEAFYGTCITTAVLLTFLGIRRLVHHEEPPKAFDGVKYRVDLASNTRENNDGRAASH